jgi:hypothetical protein
MTMGNVVHVGDDIALSGGYRPGPATNVTEPVPRACQPQSRFFIAGRVMSEAQRQDMLKRERERPMARHRQRRSASERERSGIVFLGAMPGVELERNDVACAAPRQIGLEYSGWPCSCWAGRPQALPAPGQSAAGDPIRCSHPDIRQQSPKKRVPLPLHKQVRRAENHHTGGSDIRD